MKNPKIEMLSTGDEVLYGQIVDTNASWLSDRLFQEGFLMTTRLTIGDNLQQLITTLQESSQKNDILIVNGGLGPTSDDLTAEAAAKANNEQLILHKAWLVEIERYFASRGRTMAPSNQKQAWLPASATIINNPVGTACGFKMKMNNCTLYFTPGVPSEFKAMIQTEILPAIKTDYPYINKPLCYRLTTMGRSESDLATEIEAKLMVPEGITIGYRSAMPIIELKLTGSQQQKNAMDQLWQQLKELVSENTLYEGVLVKDGEIGLAKLVVGLLNKKALSIAIVEQQTAGLIGYQLFAEEAPIVKAEMMPMMIDEPQHYLATLLAKTKADIALGLVNFKDQNSKFTLILATPKQTFVYHLRYISRKHSRNVEQQIFATIALDGLRRYLLDMPIIGPNIWLELLK
ncbi:CinA family nicotinamide mononucleotide deamidase-related protein [Orbaceae bacterium ESL0727]|nr:CinA family nicotinamide mononucleotide deamidase-related protein [Orbaceae bacterium ESL0727]